MLSDYSRLSLVLSIFDCFCLHVCDCLFVFLSSPSFCFLNILSFYITTAHFKFWMSLTLPSQCWCESCTAAPDTIFSWTYEEEIIVLIFKNSFNNEKKNIELDKYFSQYLKFTDIKKRVLVWFQEEFWHSGKVDFSTLRCQWSPGDLNVRGYDH